MGEEKRYAELRRTAESLMDRGPDSFMGVTLADVLSLTDDLSISAAYAKALRDLAAEREEVADLKARLEDRQQMLEEALRHKAWHYKRGDAAEERAEDAEARLSASDALLMRWRQGYDHLLPRLGEAKLWTLPEIDADTEVHLGAVEHSHEGGLHGVGSGSGLQGVRGLREVEERGGEEDAEMGRSAAQDPERMAAGGESSGAGDARGVGEGVRVAPSPGASGGGGIVAGLRDHLDDIATALDEGRPELARKHLDYAIALSPREDDDWKLPATKEELWAVIAKLRADRAPAPSGGELTAALFARDEITGAEANALMGVPGPGKCGLCLGRGWIRTLGRNCSVCKGTGLARAALGGGGE